MNEFVAKGSVEVIHTSVPCDPTGPGPAYPTPPFPNFYKPFISSDSLDEINLELLDCTSEGFASPYFAWTKISEILKAHNMDPLENPIVMNAFDGYNNLDAWQKEGEFYIPIATSDVGDITLYFAFYERDDKQFSVHVELATPLGVEVLAWNLDDEDLEGEEIDDLGDDTEDDGKVSAINASDPDLNYKDKLDPVEPGENTPDIGDLIPGPDDTYWTIPVLVTKKDLE